MPAIELADRVRKKNTFDRVVCWRMDDTRQILDIEATRSSDAVFMATHSPISMRRKERHDREASTEYAEAAFLDDFLDPNEEFRFVPVLGKTGVGKSHLVRWLDIQIRKYGEAVPREVLLVEKAGSNLRTVLERILSMDATDGEAFDAYRERLEKAAEDIAEGELKERILVELRFAVQNYESTRPGTGPGSAGRDVKGYVARLLPDLLKAPYFEDDWLADGGVIDRTYKRSFKNTNQHDRPAFDLESLPLEKSQVEVQRHAPDAGNAYRKLDRDDFQEAAVDVLNECLGTAVGRLLNFKGDDLLQLMIDIRREFGRRGVELVLLIEDIAAVQGLDRQLLASLERSDEDLGVLRTAMGCTDGYFDSNIPNTTKDRASFLLDLDVKDRGAVDLATFASRYLNAIRLGRDQLDNALNGDTDVPRACSECPFADTCHQAFGSRNGTPGEDAMGLYPFTEAALETMYEGISDQAFNPRQLIMNVLRSVLVNHTEDLEEGTFPPQEIREKYRFKQSVSVNSFTVQKWKDEDPEHAQQRILLADTWSRQADGEDLSPVVFEAFGLDVDQPVPPVSAGPGPQGEEGGGGTDAGDEPGGTTTETKGEKDVPGGKGEKAARGGDTTSAEQMLREQEDIINQWSQGAEQGGKMPQSMVEMLRGIIHEAVVQRIDWDAEGLSESFFARQSTNTFCKTSIDFNGGNTDQDVQPKTRRVKLQLPFEDQDPIEVQIALEGLLRAQHYGDWTFQEGREYLMQVSTCLEAWADHVLDQLRRPSRDKPHWNPAPAAAELLAVRARLAGVDMSSGAPLPDRVNALFESYSPSSDDRSNAWKKVVTGLDSHRRDLIDILEAHAWLRKGAGARTKVYDIERFASVLDSLDEHETLQAPFNATSEKELREEYRPLWTARKVVNGYLSGAREQEVETLDAWMGTVDDAFDADLPVKDQVTQVNDAIYAARDTTPRTLFSPSDLWKYETLASDMQSDEVQAVIASIRDLLRTAENATNPGPILTGLGPDRHRPMDKVSKYITSSESLLQDIDTGLESDIQSLERGEGDLGRTLTAIEDDLDILHDELTMLRDLNVQSASAASA